MDTKYRRAQQPERRCFVKISVIRKLSMVLVLWAVPLQIGAQDAKLVEAAKKEGGKVVVYGSIENDTMDLISAAFKKKTGLEVDFWRAASTKVMDRALS